MANKSFNAKFIIFMEIVFVHFHKKIELLPLLFIFKVLFLILAIVIYMPIINTDKILIICKEFRTKL